MVTVINVLNVSKESIAHGFTSTYYHLMATKIVDFDIASGTNIPKY